MKSLGSALLLSISITTAASAQMRITEWMYNPSGTGGEFIEFTNVGNAPIDMTGWSFDDNSRAPGSQSLSGFGIVLAKQSVILTESTAATFRTDWSLPVTIPVLGGNTNNLGRDDEVNLYDSSSALIDRLSYGDDVSFPGTIRTQGKSGWTTPANLGINDVHQWVLSTVNDAQLSYTSARNDIGNPGTYTPEPATMTMLVIGAVALVRRRR